MSELPDYYALLGIAPEADMVTIRRAYRRLARRYHPDMHPPERKVWAEERMRRLNLAYEVLRDPERRRRYDAQRRAMEDRWESAVASSPRRAVYRSAYGYRRQWERFGVGWQGPRVYRRDRAASSPVGFLVISFLLILAIVALPVLALGSSLDHLERPVAFFTSIVLMLSGGFVFTRSLEGRWREVEPLVGVILLAMLLAGCYVGLWVLSVLAGG